MTDSVAKASFSDSKSTRLDPPHDLTLANREDDQATPWMAIAGRDPSLASDQLDRQTSELLAYVQQQNDEIDQRQSELNAKLAQLDNEMRSARLRTARDVGMDLIPGTTPNDPAVNPNYPAPVTSPPVDPTRNVAGTDFEEVERLVAQFASDDETQIAAAKENTDTSENVEASSKAAEARLDAEKQKIEKQTRLKRDPAHRSVSNPSVSNGPMVKATVSEASRRKSENVSLKDHIEQTKIGRSELELDIEAMATSLDASELESERRQQTERKIELDRRAGVLQKMQSDTQKLHREALEMRLVTEQALLEISQQAPAGHIEELLTTLRERLNQHYADQQNAVQENGSKLVTLQQSIEEKQEELRQQSAKFQQWVEARHEEIKSYASEIDARGLLLDRREKRMREEFSKWEASRATYQDQLQSVLSKLAGKS